MDHIKSLKKVKIIATEGGSEVEIFQFVPKVTDKHFKVWARHFRQTYCPDKMLSQLISGSGKTSQEYLIDLVFPDSKNAPGPSVRAGDFAEILVADYLEFSQKYVVPRIRWQKKAVRNESVKGCDIIGFSQIKKGKESQRDRMIVVESKAALTKKKNSFHRLQDAVDDSASDLIRSSETLSYLKKHYLWADMDEEALMVQRFQGIEEKPYQRIFGAVAVIDSSNHSDELLQKVATDAHNMASELKFLVVIHGPDLMNFVHALYDEASQ